MSKQLDDTDIDKCLKLSDNEFIEVFGNFPIESESEGEDELEVITKLLQPNDQNNELQLSENIEENNEEPNLLENRNENIDTEAGDGPCDILSVNIRNLEKTSKKQKKKE